MLFLIYMYIHILTYVFSCHFQLLKFEYATKDEHRHLNQSDGMRVDISMFNEDNPSEHQMNLLFGCGKMYGLRGSNKHTEL